ncbi:MAG: MinD/ParA family protein [Epsilonproteobacteria bacterium]|nr:flagellar biosynthesis switch protein FlhG [Campylobacterota bacterium]NPA57389.1 MinD/ParA family protein [Campylobacterota bacterium]
MNDQAWGLRELVAKKGIQNSKFITIASGKGGVGKTNFAVNFAYVMANEFQKKILLIDADIGMANIHLFLSTDPNKNMKNFFGGTKLEEVIQEAYGFDVLLGFSGIDELRDLDEISVQSVIYDLERVSQNYDYVVIDTSGGVDEKVMSFLRASSKSYIITTPEPTALTDAYALIRSIYNLYGYQNFKIIVNMCRTEEEGQGVFNKLKMTVKKFLGIDIELLGILPYTNNLPQAVRNKELVAMKYPKDLFTMSVKRICEIEAKIQQPPQDDEHFWQKIFDFMGK